MTPELQALSASLLHWSERTDVISTVRAMDHGPASPDLSVFEIIGPGDAAELGVSGVAAAVEQLAASMVPGPVMPTLLAGLLGVRERTAAVAFDPGTLAMSAGRRVSGETGPVLGADADTTLLLAAADRAGDIWFLLDPATPGVTVTRRRPLDFSRELAGVRLDDVAVEPIEGLTTARVRDLAAVLFAAEAAGVAAWCVTTATEYAKTRKQFGRLIGEFQAVKHMCAMMHCRAERAAALAWDAARSLDERPPAVAVALDDAVENAKDCIQVLGGIGFTWEHDAHLYLRRAVALRALAPPTPREAIRAEEQARQSIGTWAIAAIRAHGTQAQKDRFVDAPFTWCQLFSEPEAGSDLAGLRTRAVKTDGGWRLSGQKVWTSLAHEADWAICLARTDPDVPKHKGLSYFVVDMHSPGLDIRPLREITGRSVFNEVFLDEVFVSDDCLIGAPGDGWRIAMTTLATERETIGGGDILAIRGVHPAVRKLLGVEQRQTAAQEALFALGPAGAVASEQAEEFLLTRCLSIAGGTTQILLNQVAERVLGLPR
ncbi:MAG: acyl-CoA dehydrogenase family protein [Streptosporangiaceae bacterium]|nr:acyl-CoA dehydrogenase family protein [Streptosporangiaceae bacterium]